MREPHGPAWLPWRPRDVLAALARSDLVEQALALLLVWSAEGSTPAKAGTRALLLADGTLIGTVGGGLVEAEACGRAASAASQRRAEMFEISLHGQAGPICGGGMRILVDPCVRRHHKACTRAAACLEQRATGLLLTRIEQDEALEVEVAFFDLPELHAWTGWPPAQELQAGVAAEEAMAFAAPATGGARVEVLAEPVLPAPRLVIAGGGHVGQAVAALGYQLGMDVVVIDDRPEFAHPERFPPGSRVCCGPIAQELGAMALGPADYVVIVTRNHELDAEALAACLDRPAAYIGMIGSRRKVAHIRQRLVASGRALPDALARIHAPIGLDVGAVTVPEIAVSILAEIIAIRRRMGPPQTTAENAR